MLLFNADGELCGYGREVPKPRRPWGLFVGFVVVALIMMVAACLPLFVPKKLEKEDVSTGALFLDAVRVGCPADPAYAHAVECVRTRRGVGFFFVDDNGVPRVVSVVGVGHIE